MNIFLVVKNFFGIILKINLYIVFKKIVLLKKENINIMSILIPKRINISLLSCSSSTKGGKNMC